MSKLATYFSVIFLSVGLSFPVQAQLGSLLSAVSSTGGGLMARLNHSLMILTPSIN